MAGEHPAEWIAKATPPRSLFSTTGSAHPALLTCRGPFDGATGHYVDDVIV